MGRAAAAALLACLASLSGAAQEQPTFRSQVRLVRLFVTVKDSTGAPVGTLEKPDFRVFDNGVEQSLSVFERETELPLSVSVLIDTSGSTAKELKSEVESVQRFLHALLRAGNSDDRASLYSFNWEVTERVGFTRSLDRIEGSLKHLKAEAGTSLYDAIYLASQRLGDREGRHAIIVVTDGGDTTSSKNYQQALQAAHLADAVLYPIVVVPITNDAGRNIGGENALATLSQGTGGRAFSPTIGAELDQAFSDVLRELRTQYLIGYYPRGIPSTKDRFHRVRVELKRPGLRVSTRSGYYGDSDDLAASPNPADGAETSIQSKSPGSDARRAPVSAQAHR